MKQNKKENTSKLKIIPLGGLELIGMNITAFEYEDSIVAESLTPGALEMSVHFGFQGK